MAEVTETQLPGIGVRHDFTTSEGERVGVLAHRGGRREILLYSRNDPDVCHTVLHMSGDDARTMAELLGATRISESVAAVEQHVEGVTIDWVRVEPGSPFAGASIGHGQFRTRTGVSIVAVVRGESTIPAPGPEFTFTGGDVAVAVGTPEGLDRLRELLRA